MEYWKRKLAAFLHDPPHKALDFGRVHEEDAAQILKAALPGFDQDEFQNLIRSVKSADWTAAAADRFCFPRGSASTTFTGKSGSTFRHPLGKGEYEIENLPEPGQALEWLQNAFGGIKVDEAANENEQWRQRFFLYWRRFLEQTVLQKGGARNMAYYPADTRIPDHSIWNHMSLASALEGCRIAGEIRPAFLIFQLGPVQDFIAASRSTRDLWSGSYLLSLLTAAALKAVTDKLGPDHIIFPALRGQGVYDVLHREEVYSKIYYKAGENGSEDSLWDRMYGDDEKAVKRLLNPTLPNRFVALVPKDQAAALGDAAENAVRLTLNSISNACFTAFTNLIDPTEPSAEFLKDMKRRWTAQVEAFPQISWAATPWQHDIEKALAAFAKLPVNCTDDDWTPYRILDMNREIASKSGFAPDNPGFLWMLNYHRAEFALAARRNTRDFEQFVTDENQHDAVKDALTGKEEIIGDDKTWKNIGKIDHSPFRENEGPYGAITIIKRLWCREETGYFHRKLQISATQLKRAMSFDSVAEVAVQNNVKASRYDEKEKDWIPANPYVAVLVLDGDEMGKWVSGAKMPKILNQLAQNAQTYLKKSGMNIDLDLPRALTPSYHMQFSEALANFATHVAAVVVEHHRGQLIYAGGDDVLAMLPATQAFACARALRAAFRGMAAEFPEKQHNYELATTQPGFMLVDKDYPIVVPGPAADVSVGIAIAHYQHPLQAIVREAQQAEKRAKSSEFYNRSAFAVSLMKRGGETIHWGAGWKHGALELYNFYCTLRNEGKLAGRFPYALAELLKPYELRKLADHDFPMAADIIRTELLHVLEQQGNWSKEDSVNGGVKADFVHQCCQYLSQLHGRRLDDFTNLFLTAAFLERERSSTGTAGGE